MLDKVRKTIIPKSGPGAQKSTLKNWVAYILFGAIIVVFALFGVNNAQMGGATGGVAATVNDSSITIQEFRSRVENMEQNARMRFDQFPEAQRRALSQELRRRALEELIIGEVIYQAAQKRGVKAADGEVRDFILQIPWLNDNGRFQRERYEAFLANMNLTSQDFERQVRKQLVTQKVQELFLGSAMPSREELRRNRVLANQKVQIRFAEIPKEDLSKLVSAADVNAYVQANKSAIEKYYNDNKIEFTSPEKVKARHILIRTSEQRNDEAAAKLAADLRKQANEKNFAQLASKHSEGPGSKAKGGDLGEFERGRMVPEFEDAAFRLEPGQISDPVKTNFGYHIILVEKKSPSKVESLAEAQDEIARKLIARDQSSKVLEDLRQAVASGAKGQINPVLARAGVNWTESGEFDLSMSSIPKLGDNPALMTAILKQGSKGGLIPELVEGKDSYVVAEVTAWKDAPDKPMDVEGLERMVAYRKSSDLIEGWTKEAEARSDIHRNPRLVQQ